jgi:non-homologous end joining protein Ku
LSDWWPNVTRFSGVLSFGLVSIPIELNSAIEDDNIRFHLLDKKCGSRVHNQLFAGL